MSVVTAKEIMRGAYEALVGDGGAGTVEPRLLIAVPWSYKSCGGHLLGIEAESHIARTILAVWNCARDCFRCEAIPELLHQHVE
jgi:hypothetical protein